LFQNRVLLMLFSRYWFFSQVWNIVLFWQHSDSNNCIAVTQPLNNILHPDVRHQNIPSPNHSTQRNFGHVTVYIWYVGRNFVFVAP
jgi:hypothetical protein